MGKRLVASLMNVPKWEGMMFAGFQVNGSRRSIYLSMIVETPPVIVMVL
jgi:hypothetical protein